MNPLKQIFAWTGTSAALALSVGATPISLTLHAPGGGANGLSNVGALRDSPIGGGPGNPWKTWGDNIRYTVDSGAHFQNTWAIPIRVTGGSSLPNPIPGEAMSPGFDKNNFLTYCTDVSAPLHLGTAHGFDPTPFASQTGVNPTWEATGIGIERAAYLFDNFLSQPGQTAAMKAGLQVAIWEVLYDTDVGSDAAHGQVSGLSLAGGRFRMTSSTFYNTGSGSTLGAAKAYLDLLTHVSATTLASYDSEWLKPNPLNVQGLLFPDTVMSAPVPDAGTSVALLGLALTGLAAFKARIGRAKE